MNKSGPRNSWAYFIFNFYLYLNSFKNPKHHLHLEGLQDYTRPPHLGFPMLLRASMIGRATSPDLHVVVGLAVQWPVQVSADTDYYWDRRKALV